MTTVVDVQLPAQLTHYGSDPDLLRRELLDLIETAIREHPRSQQTRIGPSEIGHDCARRIGYKLLGHPENPGQPPNWKATVGTALHTWLEQVMGADNARTWQPMGVSRWLLEQRVNVGEMLGQPIEGSCDLFDQVTGTVVDWKTCGPTQLAKYKTKGPGNNYRAQAHLYGRGWQRRGHNVERVAIVFLPRNGELADTVFWTEPYDEQIALDALQRLDGIALTVQALGVDALPVLGTADAFCHMCDYFKARSTDPRTGCPGDPGSRPNNPRPALDPNNPFGFQPTK